MFLFSLFIRILSLFLFDVLIVDDFQTMYEASRSLISGDLSFMNDFYFRTFSYQLGFTLYEAFLLKIVPSVIFLKIVNSIFTSLSVVFIYLISEKFVSRKISCVVSFFYLFYLYPIYLNSVLTNQHIPLFLMLLVIYGVLSWKWDVKHSILIGVLLAISNFFRAEAVILLLGIVIYSLLFIRRSNFFSSLLRISTLFFSYFLVGFLFSQFILFSYFS